MHSRKFVLFLFLLCCVSGSWAQKKSDTWYEIRIYHFRDSVQEKRLDAYLSHALLPALHRLNHKTVGVFKPIANDTAVDRKIIMLIPFRTPQSFASLLSQLENLPEYKRSGADYLSSSADSAAFSRYERILLKAFAGTGSITIPKLAAPAATRIYELRSYESATEVLHQNKVEMFVKGNEIGLFDRLGFNGIFYGSVQAGAQMPNLMYMTSFENMDERNAHWKSFSSDPQWKVLSADPHYQKNVSRIEITLMRGVDYSDF